MSVKIEVYVKCDGDECDSTYLSPDKTLSHAELREEAHKHGWALNEAHDFCPDCR